MSKLFRSIFVMAAMAFSMPAMAQITPAVDIEARGMAAAANVNHYHPIATEASVKAAVAQACINGGEVDFPSGNITLSTGPIQLCANVSYVGVMMPLATFSGIPDNPWTFPTPTNGTIITGNGTFPCFAGNNTALAAPSGSEATEMNKALKNVRITGFGLQGCTRGIDAGATNSLGLFFSDISWLSIRNMSDWGLSLVNPMHDWVRNVWVSSDVGDGSSVHIADDYPSSYLQPGNLELQNIYAYQANVTKHCIDIEAVGSALFDEIHGGGRLQCNRFGGVPSTQAATMSNGSTTIGVTDTSIFPVGQPVYFSATANGFKVNQTYFVLSASTSSGAGNLTVGNCRATCSAISATGSTAVNIGTKGQPNFEFIAGSGGGLDNLIISHLDVEGFATANIYAERTNNSTFGISTVTNQGISSLVLRGDVQNYWSSWKELTYDADGSGATNFLYGATATGGVHQLRMIGTGYDQNEGRDCTSWILNSTVENDVCGLFLTGGQALQSNTPMTMKSQSPQSGTLSLDAGRAGILACNGSSASTFTLPTITNASRQTSWLGIWYLIPNAGTSTCTVNTDGTQVFNGISGKTSFTLPAGQSAYVVATQTGSSTYGWTVTQGGFNQIATATNDNAPAGAVGEVISSTVASGSAISLTTATPANITSISLTAGDWNCWAVADYTLTSATATDFKAGISATSGTFGAQDTYFELPVVTTALSGNFTNPIPTQRISLASSTTEYLVGQATFSAGSEATFGTLTCRRAR